MFKIGNIEFADKSIFLAPMEDYTDSSCRQIASEFGADMVFTEFISAEGIIRRISKSLRKAAFTSDQRPIAVQIFGNKSEVVGEAVQIISELYRPDLIDLNFGCPVRKIVKKKGGAALLKEPEKMVEICKAAVKASKIPITVKTRLGWDSSDIIIEKLAEELQGAGISALTIHGRTAKQMYKGQASWDYITKVKQNKNLKIPIIGNGDITSPQSAKKKFEESQVDAIMIGRATIGNPWIIERSKDYIKNNSCREINKTEKLKIAKKHFSLYMKNIEDEEFAITKFRKHFFKYFNSFPFFKQFKIEMIENCKSSGAVFNLFDRIESFYKKKEENI